MKCVWEFSGLETPDTATFIGFAESTRPCPLCLCWRKRRYQKRKGRRRRCGASFDDSFSGSEKGWLSGFLWKSMLLFKLIQVVCIITSCSAKGILRRFLNVARTEINSGCINLWEISQQSTCDMFEKRYSWRFLREVGEYPLPPL